MTSRLTAYVLIGAGLLTSTASADTLLPPRALGLGGALRGAATGDAGPMLNPAGMSLIRAYTVEAAYEHLRPDSGHVGHVSIVDSTSSSNLAGALYYTFTRASPDSGAELSRHDGGLSLSYPFGERLAVGATVKYLRATREIGAARERESGFTADAGLSLRLAQSVTFGVVGYGLRDLKTPDAPLAVGGGAAFAPRPELVVVFDGVVDFTTYDETRGNATSLMGGVEYTFGGAVSLRAGGGYDGLRARGHASGGASLVSQGGAIDIGVRQEVSGDVKATVIGVAGRLFVPQ